MMDRLPIVRIFARACVAAFVLCPAIASAEIKIRLPVEYQADVAPGLANQEFKKLIEERSKGAIKVEFYPNGSLYKGLDLLQAVLRGDAEMTTLVSVYWSSVSPQLSVFELPFALPTHEAFYRATEDKAFMTKAFSEIEAKGGRIAGVLVYDYLPLGNIKRPVVKPEDFKGLKLRALGRTNSRTLELLGASPVPINITEVAVALDRGVIDGLNTPADAYLSYKWEGVVKYITDSHHYFAFYPWAINAKWWAALDPDSRSLIQSTIDEVTAKHRVRARHVAAESLEKLAAAGVKVHKLSADEEKAWQAATAGQWTEAEQRYGKDFVDALRKASGAASN